MKQRDIIQVAAEVRRDTAHTLRNVENCTARRNHWQRRHVWLQLLKKIELLNDTTHSSDEYGGREVEVRKHPFSH